MKIFDSNERWNNKVNFVDENNVALGYDMEQSCCENADWFIADKPTHAIIERKEVPDASLFVFDPDYFESVDYCANDDDSEYKYNALDSGEMVIFRIVNGNKELFLHLYNCHNGYYLHGFTFTVDGQTKHEKYL